MVHTDKPCSCALFSNKRNNVINIFEHIPALFALIPYKQFSVVAIPVIRISLFKLSIDNGFFACIFVTHNFYTFVYVKSSKTQ